VRGKKGGRELLEKRRGDECVFIAGEVPGWRMRSGRPLTRMHGGTCELEAESGASEGRFRHPFHRALIRGLYRFKLVLWSCGPR
jgi:hypothetical protein